MCVLITETACIAMLVCTFTTASERTYVTGKKYAFVESYKQG
jgi:hypothetical protein